MGDEQQTIVDKKVFEIGNDTKRIGRIVTEIYKTQVDIAKMLNSLLQNSTVTVQGTNYVMNIPNIVPDISGKQIVNMASMGWTVDQISYISGYTPSKVISLYNREKGIKTRVN